PKVPDLQGLCKEQRVDSSGTKNVMIERLNTRSLSKSTTLSSKGKEPASPENLEDTCGAIIVTTTKITNEPEMIEGVEQALKDVLLQEELYIEHEPLTVGNQRGISLIHLPREMAIVKTELADTKMHAAALAKRVFSLENQVKDLTLSSVEYKKIRHRFLTLYGEITTPELTPLARKQIKEGNAAAHGGDAKTDAELYRGGNERKDVKIFSELYGFIPQVVWVLTHMESINVLNLHAGIKADQREQINPKFYEVFEKFTDAWMSSSFSNNYLH
ncbi:hypothetical protein B9Z19DRAFT_921971, partial [Tuber borchii]